MKSVTSALLRIGREPVPPKMTSSIPAPRIEVGRFSPITQRSASRRLDLPQPLGPTMPVNPGSMKNSVGSTKDLKPLSLRRVNFKVSFLLHPPFGRLLLHQGIENFLKLVIGYFACMRGAVDEEGGSRIDVVFGLTFHPIRVDKSKILRILGAGLDFLTRKTREASHLTKPFEYVLPRQLIVVVDILYPVHLILEQEINEGKILIPRQAAGDRGGHAGRAVQGIFAEHHSHLAGVDVILVQLGNDVLLESGTMRAGHGGVFDDRDRCRGGATHHVGGFDLDILTAGHQGERARRTAE